MSRSTRSASAEHVEHSKALAELVAPRRTDRRAEVEPQRPDRHLPRFAIVRVSLEDVKAVKNALGGTVNDVVLASVTGGLRRLLLERGEEPPDKGLRAMVPVNIRGAGERLALGNRITSLFVHLPVVEPEAAHRYRLTLGEAETLKSGNQAVGGQTLLGITGVAPPVLHGMLARSLFASRLFNVTVTNVPGPQIPLYALVKLREIHPLVPIAAEHALGIAVVSYDGQLVFGVNADRDTVPDVAVLADGIRDSLAELQQLAGVSRYRQAPQGAGQLRVGPASGRTSRSNRSTYCSRCRGPRNRSRTRSARRAPIRSARRRSASSPTPPSPNAARSRGSDEQPVLAVDDLVLDAADRAGDHRPALPHRLGDGEAEALGEALLHDDGRRAAAAR